jgi:two-component system NarL family response regulator
MLRTDTIQVQVVHCDALVAAGLVATLRDQGDIGLVWPVGGDRESPGTAARHRVDVIVADYERGLSLLARARVEHPSRLGAMHPPVLIVSQRDTEFEIRHALEAGARGFLLLGCGVDELVNGVRALRAGLRHLDGKAAQRLADSVACEALTDREQAVLRLVVEGLGNKAIANRLEIAIGTVKSHLKSIFQKLNAASRTEVATVAERRGLLTVCSPAANGRISAPA